MCGCPAVASGKIFLGAILSAGYAISLANEDATLPDFELVGFCNAAEIGEDGWTLIPYGEWPHAEGIQKFGLDQAKAIVNSFKSTWGRFKRAVIGLPVYKGHPDLRGLENEYPDKTEYGQVADMEARPEGLAIKQILSAAGAALVEKGMRFISPHWLANEGGERNGIKVYLPASMKSVGLTNRPNIPNKSLVNSKSVQTMKPELFAAIIALLQLKPLANATEVTDEQLTAAVTDLSKRPTPDSLTTLANEKSTLLTRATTAETDLAKAKEDLKTAQTALANAKTAKITELLDAAVRVGKIAIADKPVWQRRLELDFEAESKSLVNCVSLVKFTGTAEQMRLAALDEKLRKGDGKMLPNEGADDIQSLVNAEMATPACQAIKNAGARYNAAFANAARKRPDLFLPGQKDAS